MQVKGLAAPLLLGLLVLAGCASKTTSAPAGPGGGSSASCLPHGTPEKLAESPNSLVYLAASHGDAFWLDTGDQSPVINEALPQPIKGSIVRMPSSGGPPEIIASGVSVAPRLVVSDSKVYWADWGTTPGGGSLPPFQIWAVPRDGTSPPASFVKAGLPATVAVDGVRVVWADALGGIVSADESDGKPSPVAAMAGQQLYALVASGGAVAWIALGTGPSFVAAAGQPVIVLDALAKHVFHDGGSVAVDGAAVYLGDSTSLTLSRVPLAGGAITLLAEIDAQRVVLAGDCIYSGDGTAVYATPKVGGETRVVPGLGFVTDLATDGQSLFVIQPVGGTLTNAVWKVDL